jgi:hypothetical protein
MSEPTSVPPPSGVRLIFTYEGDEVTLVSQERVDVAVTGFDAAPEQRSGHFAEVRGAAGQGLTRVPLKAAFADSVEVFGEAEGEAITRVPNRSRSGAFTVIVPARPDARSVAVIRVDGVVPSEHLRMAGAPAEPHTVELATFALEV